MYMLYMLVRQASPICVGCLMLLLWLSVVSVFPIYVSVYIVCLLNAFSI